MGEKQWPEAFGEWQLPLERVFFQNQQQSAPFALNLEDSDAIQEWPDPADVVSRLAKSVRDRLDWSSKTDVFGPLKTGWSRWRSTDRSTVPPNLGVLALTVAAATEMHRDKSASSSAYFFRLAQLLFPESSEVALIEAKEQLSASFDCVAAWWHELSDWIDRHPEVGVNTIQRHPTLTRIGYPMSQAVILRSDRMRLTHFFAKLDLSSLQVPSDEILLARLHLWASTPRGLSAPFQAALNDKQRQTFLGTYLHRLATEWDGVVLTAEGVAQLDIRLAMDLDEFTCQWVVMARNDADSLTVKIDGQAVHLVRPEYGKLYVLRGPMPKVSASPSSSPAIEAKGESVAGSFTFPALLPLRPDPDAGWLSQDDVRPFEPHILLVAPEWCTQVEKVLKSSARDGWKRIQQSPQFVLVPGRAVYIRVEFENEGAFSAALSEISPLLAKALRPGGGFRPRLVNGLRVHTKLGSRHYLRGGEPDLLLPRGDEPRTVRATLDNRYNQEHPFLATGFPIPLRLRGMDSGPHLICADGESLSFNVHDAENLAEEPRIPLGWRQNRSEHQLDQLEHTEVATCTVGARVAGTAPDPILLRRRGREQFVSDRHGEFRKLSAPPPNPLFARLRLPDPMLWEYSPSPEVVWLFERRALGQPRLQLIRYAEPHFTALKGESRTLWEFVSSQLSGTSDILDIYVKAWEGHRKRDR